MNGNKTPSFKAKNGREPVAGLDYDDSGELCQDDYEYLTGTGRYTDYPRKDRSVNVSMSGLGLLVSLLWYERSDDGQENIKATYLEYPGGQVTESVEKAINILVGGWDRLFADGKHMSVVCKLQNGDEELFDFIADAEEPEQAFISRYVLEYEGGKHAVQRKEAKRIDELLKLRPLTQGA